MLQVQYLQYQSASCAEIRSAVGATTGKKNPTMKELLADPEPKLGHRAASKFEGEGEGKGGVG